MPKVKEKKISAKKQKYAKFKKSKETNVSFTPYDFDDEELKEVRQEEDRIEKYFRFSRNKQPHEIVKRREVSKR